jgi:xanthine/uracil permease
MNETAKGQWNKKLKGSVETKVLVILSVCVVIVFVFFATRPKDSFFERLGVQIGAASGIYIAIGVFITWKFLEYNHEAVDRVWLNFHKLMNERAQGNFSQSDLHRGGETERHGVRSLRNHDRMNSSLLLMD